MEAQLKHERTSESSDSSEWEWLTDRQLLEFYGGNHELARAAITAATSSGRSINDPNLPGQEHKLYQIQTKRKAVVTESAARVLHNACV